MGTAVEPIIGDGKVFIPTHAGNLYAIDASSGEVSWRFQASGPFLQSPACMGDVVLAASADGRVYASKADSGELLWSFDETPGGFSASPVVAGKSVFVGSRPGNFYGMALENGKELWRAELGIPIRQTAAIKGNRIFVTSEDLRLHCFDASTGKELWHSEQMYGQTARDYYPIVVQTAKHAYVIIRTNPLLNMGQRVGRDRTMLCRNAGIDDSSWKTIEAWIKGDSARGTPDLCAKEQEAISAYLGQNPDAQTFYVFEAETGKQAFIPPVLWIAGCQGVGAEPALTADGRLLVFYRSAYENWNHGVAPLVALGLLDLDENKIAPLFHQQGSQPQWNCFWGTADESQNFVVCGNTVLIVHQGTLSGFDLKENRLFPIYGERDTHGGFRSPAWARNEWHGPGRGGVAVGGNKIYWVTGSRLLCLVNGSGESGKLRTTSAEAVRAQTAKSAAIRTKAELRRELNQAVEKLLERKWAPLFIDPGLSGRDFSFDDSGDYFESLSFAFPHLDKTLQEKSRTFLREEWKAHCPVAPERSLSLKDGTAREWFQIPESYRSRLGTDPQPHPFGNVWRVWLWGRKCREEKAVLAHWKEIRNSYQDFKKLNWKLDPEKGHLFANRYTASLLALREIANNAGDSSIAAEAEVAGKDALNRLAQWWSNAAEKGTLRSFKGSGELDPFITRGDAISFKVAPHRHKIALFRDLSPELAVKIKQSSPEAVESLWKLFSELYATWWVVGEERQVHFGENFVDPPDLALGGFQALAWLKNADGGKLSEKVDLPFGRADLFYIEKLALALDGSLE
jgi:hypothetical protein